MSEIIAQAEAAISKGSKTFALAAKFFPRDQWVGACQVYYWCRHCDDVIDEGGGETSLELLCSRTNSIWDKDGSSLELPFQALKETVSKFQIPQAYPLDLLAGMGMDVRGTHYQTIEDLKLYCYRVASTVGLMMSHVMGLFSVEALKEAAHLGMAMQMTNMARDIREDFEMGRCYLPQQWLDEVNVKKEEMMMLANRSRLWEVVQRLINESETLYDSGLSGIRHLPFRSAFTILIAGKIYREIGREILRLGPSSLDQRTVVPFWRKMALITQAFCEISFTIPQRIFAPKATVTIDRIWRLT